MGLWVCGFVGLWDCGVLGFWGCGCGVVGLWELGLGRGMGWSGMGWPVTDGWIHVHFLVVVVVMEKRVCHWFMFTTLYLCVTLLMFHKHFAKSIVQIDCDPLLVLGHAHLSHPKGCVFFQRQS